MKLPNWYLRLEDWCWHNRIKATAPVAIVLLLLAHPSWRSLWLGGVIVLLGEAGRIWASGYLKKNERLATAGPYRFTRNPLYFFNFVIFVGFCVMANNFWAFLLGVASFVVIYRPCLRNEAARMQELFGEEYRRWAARVPLFFPRPTGWQSDGHWRALLVLQHREHKNALAVLAGIGLFVLIWWWQTR